MTFKRFIIALLSMPLLSYWLILSPVIPNSENDYAYYTYSDDGKWKIGEYPVSATTPISFIQFLFNKEYIVLYNDKGEYIGQSTPFCTQSVLDPNILFPTKSDLFVRFIPETCDFSIPVDNPTWWSKIIKFRLNI